VHGCILRIQRPGETRTYLVDPQFPKRTEARSAVCLLAMSQGVGNYIRELKEEAENKLPAARRKLANEKILQTLSYECTKVKLGNRLIFVYATERDGMLIFVLFCRSTPLMNLHSLWLHPQSRYFFEGARRTGVHCEHGIS